MIFLFKKKIKIFTKKEYVYFLKKKERNTKRGVLF